MKKTFALLIFFLAFAPAFAFARDESSEAPDSKLSDKLSFSEGTFLGDAKAKGEEIFGKIEVWRGEKKVEFKASLEKAEKERSAQKNEKGITKALNIAHIVLLSILLFVFSIKIAFYVLGIGLAFWLIRRVFHFIIGLFRRRPERA